MQKVAPKIFSLALSLAAAALLAAVGGLPAQDAGEEKPEQAPAATAASPAAAPAPRTGPRVAGTVLRWTGDRIDLKTPDGKTEKVAVNRDTQKLTEIKPGADVVVEYRRKIGGFVIAERVLAGQPDAATAQASAAPAAVPTVTGTVVTWNDAALVLKTDAGDVTLFLSPATQYLVKSLDAGLAVTVEYQQVSEQERMATRVRAAGAAGAVDPR